MNKLKALLFIALASIIWACSKPEEEEVIPEPPKELEISSEFAQKWAAKTLEVVKESPDNSPTYTSRTLGYTGLAMYESVVNGSIIFKSVASQLNGLSELPTREGLDWETSLNASQKTILSLLYEHTSTEVKEGITSLYNELYEARRNAGISDSLLTASASYGEYIAEVIYEWSRHDNGHEGYNRTFDANYSYPSGLGYWKPPVIGQSAIPLPMHPYWGENRLFIPANDELPIPEITEYSSDTASQYYKEMRTVYEKNISLTQEEKEDALWWGDDPAFSASPPGHSYYLSNKLVSQEGTQLFEAASVFAKVGMAVSDAFVRCWKCKYHYHAERPTAFINRYINARYSQFWPEPPFPAFTSGHSTQAAAAATALLSVYPNETPLTDDFHEGRPMDQARQVEFKSRSFSTIWGFAEECGWSRILGGIHTPQDNVRGLEEGKSIGENVSALEWKY
ncbi:vanadium-dependent haloperoxidase [Jiulongibacter sp. NS-SX5]|uniref:vanadium-dependent haloperoxidase n=1 Tax=Jiulongibacter sp. NS-SX5 TaxID=3463854 RepID=UPI00405947C3